jgi:HAMP domain-containing protein
MFRNLRLSKKFNVLLLAVFVGAVILSGVAFSTILTRNAEAQVTEKANLLLQTMLAVRQYTGEQVNPELIGRLQTESEFLPQIVPGYSAREVMENLRSEPAYQEFFYKEATLNPTNLRDKADAFETELVEKFRDTPSLKELTGYRNFPSGDLFYIARPIVVSNKSCLTCHSTPEAAPKSQIAAYGNSTGFGWELNSIVGAQVISVPASGVMSNAQKASVLLVSIVAAAFAFIILVINLLLKRVVIRPLNQMAIVANEVSIGNIKAAEFSHNTNDEIGRLATAFNRMNTSLLIAMDMLKYEE